MMNIVTLDDGNIGGAPLIGGGWRPGIWFPDCDGGGAGNDCEGAGGNRFLLGGGGGGKSF